MKESISYTFLLNIIITFIFICFAVIMGIFSYYRAFRANTAILNSIEKYEGFNCLAQDEIKKSLQNIGYNTPFRANRKTDNKGRLLTSDNNEYGGLGYSVLYYDRTNDSKLANREYQYGVYTYMYMDLPIVNNIIKLSVYGKSNKMYEFRELTTDGSGNNTYDKRILIDKSDTTSWADAYIVKISAELGANGYLETTLTPRIKYKLDVNMDGTINSSDAYNYGATVFAHAERKCGTFIDYSIYN